MKIFLGDYNSFAFISKLITADKITDCLIIGNSIYLFSCLFFIFFIIFVKFLKYFSDNFSTFKIKTK
ncbi:hypothetical protein C4N20_06405 [Fusobacterium ulcerans]|nr:hypothetical protein C4N20_06405 [Fusobacterium ulcerans]